MFKKIVRYSVHKLRNPYSKIYFNSKVSLNSKLGKHSVVMTGTRIGECTIGDYTYINVNCTFERTTIGLFCSVGQDVLCGLGAHPLDFISTYPGFYSKESSGSVSFGQYFSYEDKKNVVIGSDVWVGARSIILGGINIGHGAVIAAGSIVTKDVPAFAIVAGVPAKIIKYRFEPELRELILKSEWWIQPIEKLQTVLKYANIPNKFIAELIKLQ